MQSRHQSHGLYAAHFLFLYKLDPQYQFLIGLKLSWGPSNEQPSGTDLIRPETSLLVIDVTVDLAKQQKTILHRIQTHFHVSSIDHTVVAIQCLVVPDKSLSKVSPVQTRGRRKFKMKQNNEGYFSEWNTSFTFFSLKFSIDSLELEAISIQPHNLFG